MKQLRDEATDRLVVAARDNPARLDSRLRVDGLSIDNVLAGSRWSSTGPSRSTGATKEMLLFKKQSKRKIAAHAATQERRTSGKEPYLLSAVTTGAFKEPVLKPISFLSLAPHGASAWALRCILFNSFSVA